MKKTNKIILMIVLVSLLLLGIGYAAIQNITLTISGKADVEAKQENFNVRFTDASPKENENPNVTAKIIDDTNAEIKVENLSQSGDTASALYTIKNESPDLSADLSIATTNSQIEYLTISSKLEKTSIKAGEETTVKVTVTVTKTPIQDNITADIGVELTAMPVQPGKEGTSEGINDFSKTPELNKYGFYFDRFYINENAQSGIVFHEDDSAEIFEIKTKSDYPGLEKDEWFCTDNMLPGEAKIEETLASGAAKVEDDGKTLINIDGSVYTLSNIIPHGIYKLNRYETANSNGSMDVWTFLENLSLNISRYDVEGNLETEYCVDNYFETKANGYKLFMVGHEYGTFNITGELLRCSNDSVYKIKKIHNYEQKLIQEPTCTENGLVEVICTDCKDYYTINTSAYNHKFDSDFNSICDKCGESIETYHETMIDASTLYQLTGNNDKTVENVRIYPYSYLELINGWGKIYRIRNNTFDGFLNLTTITIPNTIRTIDSSAFDQCSSLTTVNYTGTKTQWDAIQIGSGNDPLINATINYNYVMPTE